MTFVISQAILLIVELNSHFLIIGTSNVSRNSVNDINFTGYFGYVALSAETCVGGMAP